MKSDTATRGARSPLPAAALASAAFSVPLALSASSSPSPNHPRTLWWYRRLRKPDVKPPDWFIPLAWTGIEACLAAAAMTGTGVEFVRRAKKVDVRAARAGVPFVGWVVLATGLTASIWALNRRRRAARGNACVRSFRKPNCLTQC